MLRIREIADAAGAKTYYQRSDYYLETPGEWMGSGAARLGLAGVAGQQDFHALCDGLKPGTAESLTAKRREDSRVGWDFNFNSSKSVGVAREIIGLHDPREGERIEDAHREAVAYAMARIEADMLCRVRADGRDEDRRTGNMIAMRVTHRTTRPNDDDRTPDPELHDHVVVFNATFDDVEGKVKAAQIGTIKHDAPYYEAIYHNRLATNLRELGYGIRRKGKGFEIAGVSDELIGRYSRRAQSIEKKAAELGIDDDRVKEKLGATTRLAKDESQLKDLGPYWDGKLSKAERNQLLSLKGQGGYAGDVPRSVAYAMDHLFERQSVVDERRLYETALRHCIGFASPEEVEAEAKRQGLLVKGAEATTQAVLDQEAALIAFGREGRGCWQPMGRGTALPELPADQQAVARHIWSSTDRVILIEGNAGTGKTSAMQKTIPGIDRPGVFLAPSAEASRGTLREKGFVNADTIARFLVDERFREQARGGYIYVDEAPMAGMKDMAAVFTHAKELGARVILQGDRKQHPAVSRGGAFTLMEEYAGCPVARLTEVRRQNAPAYKDAVATIARGDAAEGFDQLATLGWITHAEGHAPLVDAYVQALKERASVLVIAPTHKEGEAVTAAIRDRLKEQGLIGSEERTFATLVPLPWTEAERGDPSRYEGGEIIQFARNTGTYRAGERVAAADADKARPDRFAVYQPEEAAIAQGDLIRITANGRDKSGKHRLNNGAIYEVAGFTGGGDIRLANGWTLAKDFGHFTHGRVITSHKSQGTTVDRVLVAMGRDSLPAISREQFYVSISRARHKAEIFSDLAPEALREAVQRGGERVTATEFMQAKPEAEVYRLRKFDQRVRDTYRHLRTMTERANQEREKGVTHER